MAALFGVFRGYVNTQFEKTYTILESLDARVGSIERTMATKEDLKNFATKDDLKVFATKNDLQAFANKYDFESFATKDDLKAFAAKYDFNSFATKSDLQEAVHTLTKLIVQYNKN